MSRIGKKPINIPENVTVKIEGLKITVKGTKGELSMQIHPNVMVEEKDKQLLVTVNNHKEKNQRSLWGLWSRLIKNMVVGVTEGYLKKLDVIGVGYRVALQGDKIVLNVGFSHPVEYLLPKGISATVEKSIITLQGIDKQQLGEVAAQIRRIKKPEPYKGKGIRYVDEVVRKKAGKTAAKGGAK